MSYFELPLTFWHLFLSKGMFPRLTSKWNFINWKLPASPSGRRRLSQVSVVWIWIVKNNTWGHVLVMWPWAGDFWGPQILQMWKLTNYNSYLGLLWQLSGKEAAYQCRRHGFSPWVEKIPWRRKGQLTPVFLPGESHGQRNLAGYSPWGRKESDTTKQMNTHACNPCLFFEGTKKANKLVKCGHQGAGHLASAWCVTEWFWVAHTVHSHIHTQTTCLHTHCFTDSWMCPALSLQPFASDFYV